MTRIWDSDQSQEQRERRTKAWLRATLQKFADDVVGSQRKRAPAARGARPRAGEAKPQMSAVADIERRRSLMSAKPHRGSANAPQSAVGRRTPLHLRRRDRRCDYLRLGQRLVGREVPVALAGR
jgi:hypothetical protein